MVSTAHFLCQDEQRHGFFCDNSGLARRCSLHLAAHASRTRTRTRRHFFVFPAAGANLFQHLLSTLNFRLYACKLFVERVRIAIFSCIWMQNPVRRTAFRRCIPEVPDLFQRRTTYDEQLFLS